MTVSHAADQGKTVFAIPGQITSPLSEAPLFLFQNGAKIAITPQDILEELDIDFRVDKEKLERILPETKEEKDLLSFLENEALHLDKIARISTLEIKDISARLIVMEIKGLVKSLGKGVYRKT